MLNSGLTFNLYNLEICLYCEFILKLIHVNEVNPNSGDFVRIPKEHISDCYFQNVCCYLISVPITELNFL